MMTFQDLFNEIATHLLTQRRKSERLFDKGDRTALICAYRSDDGLACAVGCVLDPTLYSREIEGQTFNLDTLGYALRADVRQLIHQNHGIDGVDLLRDLQNVHDEHDLREWPSELQHVADQYGLATPMLDGFDIAAWDDAVIFADIEARDRAALAAQEAR